jgi:hypothetical protein
MESSLKEAVNNALATLPTQVEIRRRIAENLQERQLLRQVLKVIEQREQLAKAEGRSHE